MVCHGGTVYVVAGTAHYSGTVRVVVVHLLSCATWAHGACRGFRPCARYPQGSVVVPVRGEGDRPLRAAYPPGRGSGAPTIRGRVEDSLTRLVVWRLIPSREGHAYGGHGCTPAR